jgi:large subunit ribosomal protein L4
MELLCFESDGSASGSREVPWPIFDDSKNATTFRNVVVAYQNNARQGDAQAKTRAEVSGSGKKPYRQKGTGMARHGERRSPIWVGGGVTFGPRKRDYSTKINRRMRRSALLFGLSFHANAGSLLVLKNFPIDMSPKTRGFSKLLETLAVDGDASILLVDEPFDHHVVLAARNIPNVFFSEAHAMNALDLAYCKKVIVSERAIDALLLRTDAVGGNDNG